jgi:hypothetical protein
MTTSSYDSPPRLVVELTRQQHNELNRLIPWGMRSQVFRVLVADLLAMLRHDPDYVLGALLSRYLKLYDFPAFGGSPDGDDRKPG